jgi:hypothetical protein
MIVCFFAGGEEFFGIEAKLLWISVNAFRFAQASINQQQPQNIPGLEQYRRSPLMARQYHG